MDHDRAVLFHLRKPESEEKDLLELLKSIDPAHYDRIVLHQHHDLCDQFLLKGAHLTENMRKTLSQCNGIISTSFHSLSEARKYGSAYTYFFCSPVFPSISKIGYSCNEDWSILNESEDFRSRAVALGGIEPSRKKELDELGYRNYAILGAVWYSEEPVESFKRLADILI